MLIGKLNIDIIYVKQRHCRRHRHLPAAEIIRLVYAAVVEFSEGTKQSDDCTAVIVKRREQSLA